MSDLSVEKRIEQLRHDEVLFQKKLYHEAYLYFRVLALQDYGEEYLLELIESRQAFEVILLNPFEEKVRGSKTQVYFMEVPMAYYGSYAEMVSYFNKYFLEDFQNYVSRAIENRLDD